MYYTKLTDFASKDALLSGNPSKLVRGTELGAEFDAIATAIATKYDSATLGASSGSSLVGFIQSGTGAVSTTVQAKLRESVSVKDFGAVGDGVADDTTAFNNALATNGFVEVPTGTYKITSQLVITYAIGLIGQGIYTSVLNKTFNGDLMRIDSNGFVMQEIGIAGNGATYTGGGVRPRGYNISIHHCKINDTADSPIIVEAAIGSSALAATYLSVRDCFLNPTNAATTYAARSVGTDDSTRPTCREFANISGGSSLIDFSGMNYVKLTDSLGTLIKFDANSAKVLLSGNRFTVTGTNITILGADHVIEGNNWGFGTGYTVAIDPTATNVYFGPTNNIADGAGTNKSPTTGVTTGAGTTHNIYTRSVVFVPAWKGSTSDYVLGNGTEVGTYTLSGRMCNLTYAFVRGSTTTNAVGTTWSWQLPFKAATDCTGSAFLKSSSGTWYVGTMYIVGNSQVAYLVLNATTAIVGDGIAPAFGTGSILQFSINYPIATS